MKVLVIRLSSLGDVTLASAALAPLHAAACEIHFLTKKNFAPLFTGHPWVTSVHGFDKASGERAAREALFAWVEREKFDFVLDLHDSLRTWSWRRRLRRQARVYVAKKERLREVLILFFRLKKTFGFGRGGRAEKMRSLAESALRSEGIPHASGGQLITKLVADESLRKKFSLPERYIVLLPGSAWPGKQWPHFPALAERLAPKLPVVALGGAEDFLCDEIAAKARTVNVRSVSLRGKTNIQESMAVIAGAEMIFGNDTGMVHVAEALGKDVVAIEGPTEESLGFSPYRLGSQIAGLDLICRPCSKTGRICWRFGSRRCLRGLSAERVETVGIARRI